MPRLALCPACDRHVRAFDRACPFCGAAITVAAPARLGVALLGLCLAACTSASSDTPNKADEAPADAKQDQPAPEPQPPLEEPTTAVPPEPMPPEPPPGEIEQTTAAEEGETGNQGTTDGSAVDEPPAAVPSKPDPRPKKTYGAPPNRRPL